MPEKKDGRGKDWGTPVRDLKETDPALYERIRTHLGEEYLDYTPGQIVSSVDNQDPRSVAAEKAWGDFTAAGGTGPKKS